MALIEKKLNNPSPKVDAGIVSQLFFWWLKQIFCHGNRRSDPLTNDLYDVLPENLSEPLSDSLEISWNDEVEKSRKTGRKPSLWRAVVRTFGLSYAKYSILIVGFTIMKVVQPHLVSYLMHYFHQSSDMSKTQASLWGLLLVASMILQTLFMRHGFFQLTLIGMRAKIACSCLTFRKIIRLSISSVSQNTSGSVINLLSNDVAKFELLAMTAPFLWIVPIQIVITTYLIWMYFHYASVVGIVILVLQLIPLQSLFCKISSKLRSKLAIIIDKRLSLMSEIVQGIRTIKMGVWEKYFEKSIYDVRSREIAVYYKRSYVKSVMCAFNVFPHRVSVFAIILIYKLQNGLLLAGKIFPMLEHLFNLRIVASSFFCKAMDFVADVNVSMKRIEKFLLLDEAKPNVIKSSLNNRMNVSIENVTATWNKSLIINVLQDVNVNFEREKLYAVVGPVGSGKSSLLKLILGELESVSGRVIVQSDISYADQQPWLFAGSVRDNILFGKSYDEKRYEQVVKACALLEDLIQLPYGDQTLVGDRGMALSGGQCARINMARAVYRDADVYLFDDPLSAVDVNVSRTIFHECIKGLLMSKTRVLVTHREQHLREADSIIFINNRRIEFQGQFSDFEKNEHYLKHLPTQNEIETKSVEKVMSNNIKNVVKIVELKVNRDIPNFGKEEKKPKEMEELIAKGAVRKAVYWKYFQAGGSFFTFILLISFSILAVLSMFGFNYWLLIWTKEEEERAMSKSTLSTSNTSTNDHLSNFESTQNRLYIFGGLLVSVIVIPIAQNIVFYRALLNASKNIHNSMFACLIKTPLRFFETNPAGRILNRFSEDTGIVDETLSFEMVDINNKICQVIAMILQILILNWWNLLPMVAVGYLLTKIVNIYCLSVQKIKRLEGTAKSPVLSLASSSLSGLLTIRSMNEQKLMSKAFEFRLDNYTSAHYLAIATGQAFGFYIEATSCIFLAIVTCSFLVLKDKESAYAGDVGITLTQVMNVALIMQVMLKRYADVNALMTNVERMFQFTELDAEKTIMSEPEFKVPQDWPNKGQIIFENLFLSYADHCEPTLKNLNFTIEPGTKVGIVGRTGAGKSSLISALLRLARIDGSLYIDGLDIKKMQLFDIRSNISIIPQEPVLFTSSLRLNIDPYSEFDDVSIWSALEDVDLKSTFTSLDQIIERGGNNLSAGQRQLLCLARAIVKRNIILVLDEATANIDPLTDCFIQETIRNKFKYCTVLTIAHRLDTVLDCDKILVMEDGQVIEYDHPYILLEKNDSHFFQMVRESASSVE